METKDTDYPDTSIFKCLFMLKICFRPASLSVPITFTVCSISASEQPQPETQILQTYSEIIRSSGIRIWNNLGLRLKNPNSNQN